MPSQFAVDSPARSKGRKMLNKRIIDWRPSYVKFVDRLFFLIILCLPFERAFIHDGQGAFLQYVVIVFACFSLPLWRRYYRKWCLGIWLYFIFLSVGTIADARTFGQISFSFFSLCLRSWIVFYMLLVSYNIARQDVFYIRRIIQCLLIFSIIVALSSILGIGVGELEERGVEGARYAVMGSNLNSTARDLSLSIIGGVLICFGVIQMPMKRRILFSIFSVLSFYALIRTGSRGGLAGLVCTLPFIVFTTKKMSRKLTYSLAIGLVLFAMVVVVLNTPSVMDRIAKSIYDRDTGGREAIFEIVMNLWSHSRLMGLGTFAYQIIAGIEWGWAALATHCTYTYALVSAGVLGGSFYYLFLLNVLINAIRVRFYPYGAFLMLCLIMALLGGITMNIEFSKWLYIIYGLILAHADLKKRGKLQAVQIQTLR